MGVPDGSVLIPRPPNDMKKNNSDNANNEPAVPYGQPYRADLTWSTRQKTSHRRSDSAVPEQPKLAVQQPGQRPQPQYAHNSNTPSSHPSHRSIRNMQLSNNTRHNHNMLSSMRSESPKTQVDTVNESMHYVRSNISGGELTGDLMNMVLSVSSGLDQKTIPEEGMCTVNASGTWYMELDWNRQVASLHEFIFGKYRFQTRSQHQYIAILRPMSRATDKRSGLLSGQGVKS
jgi:hypothetical protein